MDFETLYNASEEYKKHKMAESTDTKQESSWIKNTPIDKPGTMEDNVATLWYVIAMICSTIFNDRLAIWAVLTFFYVRFKNRHKRR